MKHMNEISRSRLKRMNKLTIWLKLNLHLIERISNMSSLSFHNIAYESPTYVTCNVNFDCCSRHMIQVVPDLPAGIFGFLRAAKWAQWNVWTNLECIRFAVLLGVAFASISSCFSNWDPPLSSSSLRIKGSSSLTIHNKGNDEWSILVLLLWLIRIRSIHHTHTNITFTGI